MDFNVFFKDNIYVLYGTFLYMLFNTDRHKNDGSKIIVIYTIIMFLMINNSLNIYFLLAIFLFLFFFQYEILIEDRFKHKLISGLFGKLFDFLYLLIFKYRFLLYLILLYVLSLVNFKCFSLSSLFYLCSSIFIYLYIILFISNNKFEMDSFDNIVLRLNPKSFGNFTPISKSKRSILIELEDKTYLYRRRSYNSISFWTIIFKFKTMINLLIGYKESRLMDDYEKIGFKTRIIKIYRFIKRQIRGHSTIEMQLFRQVALKDGYYEIGQRKIAEYVYSTLIFKGLKRYLKRNYTIVSFERYKDYLIDEYLKYAPVFLNKLKFDNYDSFFENRDVTDCDFLFYVLCLSSKLDKDGVLIDGVLDYDFILERYNYLFYRFNISDDEVKDTVNFFNKKIS